MIQLPSNFTADITTQATQLIASFAPFLTLILGILVGMLVLGWLIDRLT